MTPEEEKEEEEYQKRKVIRRQKLREAWEGLKTSLNDPVKNEEFEKAAKKILKKSIKKWGK